MLRVRRCQYPRNVLVEISRPPSRSSTILKVRRGPFQLSNYISIMNFPERTLRWQNIVSDEIGRGSYPFPSEYPLAVILVESSGKPGVVNPTSGASGIMQIMPNTLAGYNQHNSPNISLDVLRTKAAWAVPQQIRVGLWVMGRYLKRGYDWLSDTNPDPPLSDLIRISDLMYVAGPARVRNKFSNLTDRSFASLVEAFPNWQPFAHPRKVWMWTAEKNSPSWDMRAINDWVGSNTDPVIPVDPPPPVPPPAPPAIASSFGMIGALLLFAFASFYFSREHD